MTAIPQRGTISLGIMQKNHLIECVRLRPCIWDIHHHEFKSSTVRQQAFTEIAEAISDSEHTYTRSEILEEWGKIRYCFVRIMKKLLSTNDESQAVSWPYWNKMQFMYISIKEHLLSTGATTHQEFWPSTGQHSSRKRSYHRSQSDDKDVVADVPISYGNGSPNDILASHVLSAINNQKRSQHEYTPSRSSMGPRSVFDDLTDDSDFGANIKSESSPPALQEKLPKISRNNIEDGQVSESSWVDPATQQFLLASIKSSSGDSNTCSTANSISKATPKVVITKDSANDDVQRSSSNQQNARIADSSSNGDTKHTEQPNSDVNEYFGRYMIRQMQSVTQQNAALGVHLRKELMEVCCKYELQAFSI
ncbi:alcohol dehydrogenase transcription factor myb/SANT-like domain-containing protein [Ditylenchus destructor]|uniref:Alcohol dehydrogenase transcription factor myb/SANT-like domain-containing protein n=1 Tax=Ditylenchus destructor TaxID=166010 RepID=A0AAD4R8F6_9BILA|nr:alcohol dehydrogenase transcription factor myb/SANT-like domain-containing protein [Ditylenchus destructor]